MAVAVSAVKRKDRFTVEGTITHGDQLTLADVGPWKFQGVSKGSETLSALNSTQTAERLSTYGGWGRPSWIPGTDYVNNNSTSNLGGVVPTGGMTVDGFTLPAGMWVVQNRDFSAGGSLIIEGDGNGDSPTKFHGVFFRGCRMRRGYGAPGFFNQNGHSCGGDVIFSYCDGGGASTAAADLCESVFESPGYGRTDGGTDHMYVNRCYLSNATSLAFGRNHGDAFIENYCRDVTDFGDHGYHLNGIANSGSQNSTLWLRNNMIMRHVTEESSTQLTDVIQMAADDGAYLGGGTNWDGSTGYTIKDNYLAGANFTLQLGYDKSNTVDQVKQVKVINNKFSTVYYTNSGESGLAYKTPDFTNSLGSGGQGNVWSGNTWADGPSAGQTISAPAANNG